jgi:uncharacterized membrane protein
MTDTDAAIISDKFRTPITAQKRHDGDMIPRGPRNLLILSASEMQLLAAFADNRPCIQRFPIGVGR